MQPVCPYGFYGQNCTKKCNSTCAGCNNVNGNCDSGCIPALTGYYCNKSDNISGTFAFDIPFEYNASYPMAYVFNLCFHEQICWKR